MRVGIDLGTTYCAVAYIDPETGKAKVIKNKEGKSITPSVLYFGASGEIIHGEEAKIYIEEGSDKTANFFKYHMGDRTYSIFRNGKEYSAIDLSAELLKGIIREAEEVVNENIYDVVITVPAYFEHFRRVATMEAGKKAGLNVLNIISEPTAAVFAYGINGREIEQTVLVYDLGGGTFDVTIANITHDEIKVLGTDGDHRLGGKDWDDALADYLSDQFYEEFNIDLSRDSEMNIALQALAEKVKKQLTSKKTYKATINYAGKKGHYEVTQETFDDITEFNLNKTRDIIDKLLQELNMGWRDIDGTLLVGGATRMRQVKRYLALMCEKPPMGGVNVDEAVALGAAIRANIDAEGNMHPEIGLALGGEVKREGRLVIAGAKRMKDATAHSMGMIAVSKDGSRFVNSIMVKKNSGIPAKTSMVYELGISRHTENKLEVYMVQGEEEVLEYPLNCMILGKYVFTGIQENGRRKEEIDVMFSYNDNNIVEVSAVQKSNSAELQLHIEEVEEDMSWVIGDPKERMDSVQPDISVFLAVDLSGSMSGDRLLQAQKAAISFIRQFDMEYVEVGLINFSDRVVVHQDLTHEEKCLINKINAWRINDKGLGYGNAAEPFTMTRKTFSRCENDIQYLVVLTDGYWSDEENAVLCAQACHESGIEVVALGFGGANKRFLDRIASRTDFASFTDVSQLEATLTGIAKIM